MGAAAGDSRRLDAGSIQVFGVSYQQLLGAEIMMCDRTREILALTLPGLDCLVNDIRYPLAGHGRRH